MLLRVACGSTAASPVFRTRRGVASRRAAAGRSIPRTRHGALPPRVRADVVARLAGGSRNRAHAARAGSRLLRRGAGWHRGRVPSAARDCLNCGRGRAAAASRRSGGRSLGGHPAGEGNRPPNEKYRYRSLSHCAANCDKRGLCGIFVADFRPRVRVTAWLWNDPDVPVHGGEVGWDTKRRLPLIRRRRSVAARPQVPGRLRRKKSPTPHPAWGGARHANLALRRLAKDDGRGEVVA
jgi:hypothetical protein